MKKGDPAWDAYCGFELTDSTLSQRESWMPPLLNSTSEATYSIGNKIYGHK